MHPEIILKSFAVRPYCWEVPATCHQAVYAYAEQQALLDHVDRVVGILASDADADTAVECLCLAARTRALALSQKLRGPMSQKQRGLFSNADLMREMPDQISRLPRATWLMGVLSALAGIEAAFTGARVCSRVMQGSFARTFHATAERHALDAQRRWRVQLDQMLERHPWIGVETVRVDLIGLETKDPRFRIAGCRRAAPGQCATSQRP